jgi:uncharacterized membrane protein
MTDRITKPGRVGGSGRAILILGVLGLAVSVYLAVIKLANATAACGGIGDCESVNNSSYAEIAGIPIAIFGAASYLVVLGLVWIGGLRPEVDEQARMAVFGVSLAGTLYSAYLSYIEVFVLHAVCPYCVVSAVCMTGIFILSVLRLRALAAPA